MRFFFFFFFCPAPLPQADDNNNNDDDDEDNDDDDDEDDDEEEEDDSTAATYSLLPGALVGRALWRVAHQEWAGDAIRLPDIVPAPPRYDAAVIVEHHMTARLLDAARKEGTALRRCSERVGAMPESESCSTRRRGDGDLLVTLAATRSHTLTPTAMPRAHDSWTDDGLPKLAQLTDRESPLSVLLRAIPGAAHLIKSNTWLLPTWTTNGEWCRLHLALVRLLEGSAPKKKWKKKDAKAGKKKAKVTTAAAADRGPERRSPVTAAADRAAARTVVSPGKVGRVAAGRRHYQQRAAEAGEASEEHGRAAAGCVAETRTGAVSERASERERERESNVFHSSTHDRNLCL
jgi:hypothetical protein